MFISISMLTLFAILTMLLVALCLILFIQATTLRLLVQDFNYTNSVLLRFLPQVEKHFERHGTALEAIRDLANYQVK